MIRRVCFRSPFLPFFGEMPSIHSRPEATLRGTVCSTNSAICLHHAHPFVAASEKSTCLMQRSKAFGHAIVVSKMFWNIVIVLSVVLWDCCKPTNTCPDWAFSNNGLEVGCQPFSCRCSQNVMHCRKEICSTCLFQESIPAIPLGNAKHPIHTRSLSFLRAAACSTGSALWLHHAHCSCRKSLSYAESGASSLSPTYVPKMWRTAEKRLTRHVCLRNPCFCGNLSLHSV